MTHYSDLAPCNYFGAEFIGAFRAVGWLVGDRDYPKGHLTPREHDALAHLTLQDYTLYLTLGRYQCELCGQALSTTDLFIPSGSQVFVAPGGILHYVECHDYLPPEAFRRAVVECPPLASTAYFAALLGTDWAPIAREAIAEPGITLEACLERERREYMENRPTTSHNAQPALTRLQKQESYVIILVFVIWFPVYLVWGMPVLNRWLFQSADSSPIVLHVVPALAVPILAALGFRAFTLRRCRHRN